MGNFSDILAAADILALNVFSKKDTNGNSLLVVYSLDQSQSFNVNAIERNLALEDDYIPGSQVGTSILKLFVRYDSITEIRKGMRAEYGGVGYDVVDVATDREGGAVLTMRKRGGQ